MGVPTVHRVFVPDSIMPSGLSKTLFVSCLLGQALSSSDTIPDPFKALFMQKDRLDSLLRDCRVILCGDKLWHGPYAPPGSKRAKCQQRLLGYLNAFTHDFKIIEASRNDDRILKHCKGDEIRALTDQLRKTASHAGLLHSMAQDTQNDSSNVSVDIDGNPITG